jgi:hypothetical protein
MLRGFIYKVKWGYDNEEWARISKETVVAYFKILSEHLSGETEENHRETLAGNLAEIQNRCLPNLWTVTAVPSYSVLWGILCIISCNSDFLCLLHGGTAALK